MNAYTLHSCTQRGIPLWLSVIRRAFCNVAQWCRRRVCRGASPSPKVLIWWKSGKNSWKSGQNLRKSRQNLWKPSQNPWKYEQKWHPTCFDLKQLAANVRRNTCRPFFHSKNSLHEKIFTQKLAQKFFGHVWGNSGKRPSHPQTFACSYTYDVAVLLDDTHFLQHSCRFFL